MLGRWFAWKKGRLWSRKQLCQWMNRLSHLKILGFQYLIEIKRYYSQTKQIIVWNSNREYPRPLVLLVKLYVGHWTSKLVEGNVRAARTIVWYLKDILTLILINLARQPVNFHKADPSNSYLFDFLTTIFGIRNRLSNANISLSSFS